jgi:hypothetical protein
LKAAILLLLPNFVVVHPQYRRRCHRRAIYQPSRVVGYNAKASIRRLWPSRYPGEFDPDPLSQPAQGLSSLALRKTGVVVHPWRNNRHWGIPSLEEWTGQIGCSGSRQYLEWPGHTRSRLGPQCWQGDRSRQLQPQLHRRFHRRCHLR